MRDKFQSIRVAGAMNSKTVQGRKEQEVAKSSGAVLRALRNIQPRLMRHGHVTKNVAPAVASPTYDAFENLTASQARAFEKAPLIRRPATDTDTQR